MLNCRSLPHRLCASALLLFLILGLCPQYARANPAPRVIAVADVHGDYDDFVAILRRAGIIDADNHWSGGNTTLVQTGDLLDRGPKPRQAIDLLMALQKEAPKSGGCVIALLGNHEAMNLMGDLRYVTPENYGSYAGPDAEKRRDVAYRDYTHWQKKNAQLLKQISQPVFEQTEEEWRQHHPAGFFEQREAFEPDGVYGKWLRERPAVTEIDSVIFLHGGISPDVTSLTVDGMNSRIREELKTFDASKQYLAREGLILPWFTLQQMLAVVQAEAAIEQKGLPATQERMARLVPLLKYGSWLSVAENGPLWFRGYDSWSDAEGEAQVTTILNAYHATHIVVGHTVQKGGTIRSRFGNEIFLIDTGMLSSTWPGGRASALSFHDGKITAEYVNQEVDLTAAGAHQGNSQPQNKPEAHP